MPFEAKKEEVKELIGQLTCTDIRNEFNDNLEKLEKLFQSRKYLDYDFDNAHMVLARARMYVINLEKRMKRAKPESKIILQREWNNAVKLMRMKEKDLLEADEKRAENIREADKIKIELNNILDKYSDCKFKKL